MEPCLSDERLEVEDRRIFPVVDRKSLLKEVPSGAIYTELGADGMFLRFECDCLDALPHCFAQCCALIGTVVAIEELTPELEPFCDFDEELRSFVLKRDSDGFCTFLDRETRTCTIYDDRPQTCKRYHCTKGISNRGWKQSNSVCRQSMR